MKTRTLIMALVGVCTLSLTSCIFEDSSSGNTGYGSSGNSSSGNSSNRAPGYVNKSDHPDKEAQTDKGDNAVKKPAKEKAQNR